MDIQTVTITALSSGVVAVVVAYFLNRRFEVAKAELQETIRRQAALFDHQKEALLRISEMSYRLRNELRDAAGPSSELPEGVLLQIEAAQASFNEALYNSRPILPEHLFVLAHDLKNPVQSASTLLRVIRMHHSEGREVPRRDKKMLISNLRNIEEQFTRFVDECRHYMGVGEATPNPRLQRTRSAHREAHKRSAYTW